MPISRCPVVRLGYLGKHVNDYHSFQGNVMSAVCKHCGQTRRQSQASQHDRFWDDDMDAAAGRPPPHERFDTVPKSPYRWNNITTILGAPGFWDQFRR